MKKPIYGPSLYYASDKNIFDALNQYRVDTKTLNKLFERRNIVVSKKTSREDLAKYFSRLTHDYTDHKDISARLGVISRRERITSVDLKGALESAEITAAVDKVRKELEQYGDVVHITRGGDTTAISVQYSTIDYKRSEFTQVQKRDGVIEIVKTGKGYVIRNTQNEYIGNIRDTLVSTLNHGRDNKLESVYISLLDVPEPKLRSKFFYELMNNLHGFVRRDVTEVYVYKAKPEDDEADANVDEGHIERVFLRGNGVTQSKLLNDLLHVDNYYIVKTSWIVGETMGSGQAYEIEALFDDPKHCTGFSFLLRGVFPLEEGVVSNKRRTPNKGEIDHMTNVIETKAKSLMDEIRKAVSDSSS